jgi:hypothetical protein
LNKEAFFMPLNCNFFSLEILDVYLDAMFEIVVIDVDDEYVPPPKKPKKVVAYVNCKFQKI